MEVTKGVIYLSDRLDQPLNISRRGTIDSNSNNLLTRISDRSTFYHGIPTNHIGSIFRTEGKPGWNIYGLFLKKLSISLYAMKMELYHIITTTVHI